MTGQQGLIDRAPPTANYYRQPLELRIAQQLDGRKKCIHVEVGNAAQPGAVGRSQNVHVASIALAIKTETIFKKFGASRVVFSWIAWPAKAVRDHANGRRWHEPG